MKKQLIIFVLCLVSTFAFAQDNSVVVTGFGETIDEARQSAFTTAVEQVMGVLVSGDILMENGELVKDRIRSKSEGFIESYTVISTGKDGELYVVTIRAVVAKAQLQSTLAEITHVNNAQLAYDAVTCSSFNGNIMCTSGDLGIGNMDFGIHMDSYAVLRYYKGDITESQLYFRLTLRENAGFAKAIEANGDEFDLKYVYSGDRANSFSARTVSQDYIIAFGKDLTYLTDFVNKGLELTITGSGKEITLKIPSAYIEGFVKYINDNIIQVAE